MIDKNPSYLSGAAAFLFAVSAAVAQPSLTAPSIGWVLDPAIHQVRPIWGLPGSASLGDPLDLGVSLTSVVLSPAQDYGLAVSDSGRLVTIQLQNTTGNQPIEGVPNAPALVAGSASVKSVATWHKDVAQISVVTGLPSALAVRQIDASSLTGDVTALAVTEKGDIVVVATATPDGATVQAFSNGSDAPVPIGSFQHVSAIAFRNETDLLVADDTANTISLIYDVAGTATYRFLAANPDGINGPVALRATADGRTAIVANQAAHAITFIDLESSAVQSVPCACDPVRLDVLSSPLLRLTDLSGAPLWILDSTVATPRIFFVPAPLSVAPEARQ